MPSTGTWNNNKPDDKIPYKHNNAFCKNYYSEIIQNASTPSRKTIICTAVIILGAILLEVLVHMSWEHRNHCHRKNLDVEQTEAEDALLAETPETVTEQPQAEDGVPVATESRQQENPTAQPPVPGYMFCCASNPTPQSRATRLACAFVLYPFILAAFIVRINAATCSPFVMADCRPHIHVPPPHWVAITFLNSIPFSCASFAFLRALIDGILVRFNTGLSDTIQDKKFPWLACLPISGGFVFGFGAVYLLLVGVFKGVRVPVALIMGRYEMSDVLKSWGNTVEEMEMQGEEVRGLVEGMETNEDDGGEGSDGPPAYDEIVGKVEGAKRQDGKGKARD